ncbi:uncharacterized protein K489DRAFT_106224 [Dissoconium aciculare CBS 342.82]|uniref:Uncharacterized protein n=1 Tax=Dissoconium aciculare CBS 342.82 TaxID=1314786 RepID=A0A6J3MDZ5_9PEZI|nr:uncharacterized protein K489DRAFT_106224 [Dissoconium aciculare CBS 342.82]KAF1826088.1 hypothetical protein K489DRAFT_106224 [Dissoconium aciculare CBS 342.82]
MAISSRFRRCGRNIVLCSVCSTPLSSPSRLADLGQCASSIAQEHLRSNLCAFPSSSNETQNVMRYNHLRTVYASIPRKRVSCTYPDDYYAIA